MRDRQICSPPTVVLVVDQDIFQRSAAAAELRREGFDVIEAADMGEAVTVLQSRAVDVLFSQLDPVSGERLMQWVKERRPATEVIWAPQAGETASVLH